VSVPNPDLKDREEILKVHCRNIKLAPSIDLTVIARRTPGFVGADLANLVNEAALLAARKNRESVEMPDFEEAIDRVIAGPQRKSRMISDREKKIIAYHESGHTLVAKMTPGSDPVHKVSIIPRGPALGYTLQLPLEDRYLTTRQEIAARLSTLMGGRVAEEMVFNEITTGAQNDLAKATEMSQKMVVEFGMSDKVGALTLRRPEEEVFLGRDITREPRYSNKTAELIDEEVKRIVDEAKQHAHKILAENQEKLKALAEALIEKEILDASEVDAIMRGETLPPPKTAGGASAETPQPQQEPGKNPSNA
jgi:cell division protease FtsH